MGEEEEDVKEAVEDEVAPAYKAQATGEEVVLAAHGGVHGGQEGGEVVALPTLPGYVEGRAGGGDVRISMDAHDTGR
jgi:hypothetical protein